MQTLITELNELKEELHKSMKYLRKHGEDLAIKEHDYQMIKTQTWLTLKSEGCTSTELANTIKGHPKVADAMLERDIARSMYEANQEHINVVKLEVRVLESQISREWNNG